MTNLDKLKALEFFIVNHHNNYNKSLQQLQLFDIDTTPLMYNFIKLERELQMLYDILKNKVEEENKPKG